MKSLYFVPFTLAVFLVLYPFGSSLSLKVKQTHSDCEIFDTAVRQNLTEIAPIKDTSGEEEVTIIAKRLDPPYATPEHATSLLENFVLDLKSYIHQTGFDYIRFREQKAFLSHALLDIGSLVLQLGLLEASLDRRYSFTKHRFEVMVVVSDHMRTAASENDAPHCLLFEVCDLRIMALTLLNSKGEPDRTNNDYDESVGFFSERLKMLERLHHRLVDMPLSVRMVVWDHIMKTEMLIKYLEQSE
ncbi:hypothetical protein METSCH_D03800 [Metschnikowia aff. pulcherrima]|uniref:Uncharacterized protein n=1 Tax=Metschnikowia aff. pulcherrima TaxID=2163413 RepID=A0A4P6XPK6_9ASCO|nr:hypothetical protein METSCH_D03800 [Metschnikowia aff. pulcherrima]